MGNVVMFTPKRKVSKYEPFNIEEEVEKDTALLAEALGVDSEKATKIATDFCKKYPVLVEYIMNPQYQLRR